MNYIAVVSFVTSIIGLGMIYVTASNFEPSVMELKDVGHDMVGNTITTEGQIRSKTLHKNGHMFLTLTDGRKELDVPVFSSVMKDVDHRPFRKGEYLTVTGVVDEYRKNLQVIPRKPNDLNLN